jgi:hypothetical protein
MTTRRREQPLNTEPPRASRIAAKVADEIQSALPWEWISPRLFYAFNFLTLREEAGDRGLKRLDILTLVFP